MVGEIILYQTENGKTKIEVILENATVWLNQYQIKELFQTDRTSIARHIKNIYKTDDLDKKAANRLPINCFFHYRNTLCIHHLNPFSAISSLTFFDSNKMN